MYWVLDIFAGERRMPGRVGSNEDQHHQGQVGGDPRLSKMPCRSVYFSDGGPQGRYTTNATVICAYDNTSKTGFYPLRKKKSVVFFS